MVQGVIKNRRRKEKRRKKKKNTVILHKIQLIYNHFDICYDKKKDNRVKKKISLISLTKHFARFGEGIIKIQITEESL